MDDHYIDLVLSGDSHAFRYFVKKYKDMVFAVALRIVQNNQDAEEISQDAFIKAYQNLKKFDRKAKFSTWLYKIVFNLALNKKRLIQYNEYSIDEVNNESFAVETNDSLQLLKVEDQKKYVNLAINSLSQDESLILTLYYLAENNVNEIIKITNWSESNIKIKLHRARKNLFLALTILLKDEIKTIY